MPILTVILQDVTFTGKVIIGVFSMALVVMMLYYLIRLLEIAYVLKNKKPLYLHFYPFVKSLNDSEKIILKQQFPFYK